ncbi:MAG: Trk system potassium transporter TrkA [Alphaproteobacteria bacterium]|nr:Trk system potassium transporter TrkA [Alphaproteobacteria bacterium]
MRVIICGAGQVGYNIAAYLARENNDVTIVDVQSSLISKISENLDVNAIVGHASNPDVLNAAGAKGADIMIAVTQSDEVNMVACQIGHSLFGIPKKIARVREQAYLQPQWSNLFSRAHMPIDVIISPEVIVAHDIYERLVVPGTSYVNSLADGKAYIIGVVCGPECPVISTPIKQLRNLFPDLAFQIIAMRRQNKAIIPDEGDQLEVGDEAFFIVSRNHLKRTLGIFGHEEKEAHKIVIVGGGNIGYGLAKLLQEKNKHVQIKMIERNADRAVFLSKNMGEAIILNGSALEKSILEESSIANAETMIAVTNDDESNILGSLLAKQYGCKRVITLVNNEAYSPMVGPLGVDVMVSPRSIIVATIMQHVRRGRIKGLYNLRDGFAEVMEAEVSENSHIVNMSVEELSLPHEIIVGGIVRDEEFMIPSPETKVKAGDVIIMLASRNQAQNVEKMFSVQVDLF